MGRNRQRIEGEKFSASAEIVWHIAVYIRLSREDGKDESDSVVNQKKILKEYLESQFDDEYVIVDFYIDDGLSGTDDSRESFMRMVHDIEAGRVNCVICKTLSRAFRNYADQGYYIEYYFPQKNIRFISTGDPKVDTYTNPDAITGLEVPITGLMNDRYAAKTSADIRRTFNTKRRNGEFIGAFPPYGYLKDPQNKNRLILDEEIVPIKREIYHWVVQEGMSLNGAAKRLNEMGIPNPTAYKRSKGWHYNNPKSAQNDGFWTGTTVRRQLLDRMNLGHMVQGKQRVVSYKVHDRISVPEDEWFVVPNTHEPTFTQEEYDALERVLQRDTRTPNGKQKVHLFSGFLRCFNCKKALQRSTAKERVYYTCRTYREKSKDKCTRHSIRLDLLESAVLATIQAHIALVDSLPEIVKCISQTSQVDTRSERVEKMLRAKHRDAERTKTLSDGLYADWKTGEITHEDYRRMKIKFEEQLAQLNAAILTLEGEQQHMRQCITRENAVFTKFAQHRNIQRLDRAALVGLIDTIYVHEGKEITIIFRFADELVL